MKRIEHPVTLAGQLVRLEPLQEHHFKELIAAAADREIWQMLPLDGTDAVKLQGELRNALLHRAAGTQYPFAIIDQATGNAIGSTRLLEIFPEHKKLEIGWTWYARQYWGKGYNPECKLLLLRYCFEVLGVNRVQIKTRDVNLRSQAAIEKLGARLEGVLRKDRISSDGQVFDTYVYSIISDEWKQVSAALTALCQQAD